LPVQQAAKFELALGFEFPPTFTARTDDERESVTRKSRNL
jgi:hypothetical protein